MNLKGIAVIVGVAVVIISVTLFPTTPGDIPPGIIEAPEFNDEINLGVSLDVEPKISDDTSVEFNLQYQDSPQIEFEAEVEKNIVNFIIDENGNKIYIIDAVDAPMVEE